MSLKWSAAIASGTLLAGCVLGGVLAYWYEETRISAIEAAHAAAMALAQQVAMAELAEVQKQNAETLLRYEEKKSELEKSNSSLADDARRLRNQLASASRHGKAGTGDSGQPDSSCAGRLTQCERLLGEGAELLAEGAGLYSECANRESALSTWKR